MDKTYYKNKTFSYACHLADIHIRLYKRHAEYRSVFEKLYEQLNEWKNIHPNENMLIIVAGDLAHAKTDMSPEMVSLLSEFLTKLVNIFPTIVIPGNHDLNLSNSHRMDALTPIIENIAHPDLHYLKESGIYTFGNVGVAVYSIMGSKDCWPDVAQMNQPVKIGLYHGPVLNAETDTGYIVSNRQISADLFDGLDIVMLGDIHKFQIIQSQAFLMRKPYVAYPGSLIQQNHGESLSNHGWIEWSLDRNTYSHKKIHSDYGYVTINVSKNKEIELPEFLPANIRLRIFSDDADPTTIKKVLALIKKKANVLEVVVNKVIPTISSVVGTEDVEYDVHDVNYQNSIIKDYIQFNYPATANEVMDKIIVINEELNSKIKEDELPLNIHWRPLKLKFDNLFSYGVGNEINFENLQGLCGIFSANATGKTSAFDALCFALYDKTPRAFKGSHIMNTREDECFCELVFEVGTQRYKIIRRGARRKNGEVKMDVEFMRYETSKNEWELLSGDGRRDTNSIIRSYVGDYNDFVLTNLSVQNQNSLFIDKGQSERKDLLSQFMGLTIFDRLYELALDNSKELAGSLKSFNKDDFTTTLANIQIEMEELAENQDKSEKSIKQYKEKIDDFSSQIMALAGSRESIDDEEKLDISKLQKDKDVIEKNLILTNVSLQKVADKIDEVDSLIQECDNRLKPLQETEADYKLYLKLNNEQNKLSHEIDLSNIALAGFKKKMDWLDKHEYDPNCKYCVNNIFVKDAKKAAVEFEEEEKNHDELFSKLENIGKQLSKVANAESRLNELKKIQSNKVNLEMKKLTLTVEVGKIKSSLLEHEKQQNNVISLIETYNNQKEALGRNIKLDEEILKLKKMVSTFTEDLQLEEKKYLDIHGKFQVLKTKKEEIILRIREAEEIESTFEAYEFYLTAVCRDGVPYDIISKAIPSIQMSVNNTLNQIVDFHVVLEIDGKNINGRIVYDEDKKWPLELASGMEKFVTGLAIRTALMSISNLPKSNFLILDEGLSVLDSENLSSMFMLFNLLRVDFEFIVLISHLDIVRDIADTLIEIKREDGYSYINF